MEDKTEKIIDYLIGRLSKEETSHFSKQIEEDEGLSQEVEKWATVLKATSSEGKDFTEFYDISRKIIKEELNKNQQSVIQKPWFWAVMGIILIGIAYLFWSGSPKIELQSPTPIIDSTEMIASLSKPDSTDIVIKMPTDTIGKQAKIKDIEPTSPSTSINSPPSNENKYLALAQNQFFPYSLNSENRSLSDTVISQYDIALKAFQKKAFHQVIKTLGTKELSNIEFLKLRANAYFYLNDFNSAAKDFQYLADHVIMVQEQSEWNLLLCQLAQNKVNDTSFLQLIKKVEDSEHSFTDSLKIILQLMN